MDPTYSLFAPPKEVTYNAALSSMEGTVRWKESLEVVAVTWRRDGGTMKLWDARSVENAMIDTYPKTSMEGPKMMGRKEKVDSGLKYGHFLVSMLDFWGVWFSFRVDL